MNKKQLLEWVLEGVDCMGTGPFYYTHNTLRIDDPKWCMLVSDEQIILFTQRKRRRWNEVTFEQIKKLVTDFFKNPRIVVHHSHLF